jgi:hypothetical protein
LIEGQIAEAERDAIGVLVSVEVTIKETRAGVDRSSHIQRIPDPMAMDQHLARLGFVIDAVEGRGMSR